MNWWILVLAISSTLSGCVSSENPLASGPVVHAFGSGAVTLGPVHAQYVHVALAIPPVGDEARACHYRLEVKNVHASSANYTTWLAMQYVTSATAGVAPQPIPFGSVLRVGDSLASLTLAADVAGQQAGDEYWVEDLNPGSPEPTIVWNQTVSLDSRFFEVQGVDPGPEPILNFLVFGDEDAVAQTFTMSLAWQGCRAAARIGNTTSHQLVTARHFSGGVSGLAGAPWAAVDAAWTGGLPRPGPIQAWALLPPDLDGQHFSMDAQMGSEPPFEVSRLYFAMSVDSPVWTLHVPVAVSDTQGRQPLLVGVGFEPARLPEPV